MLRIVKTQVSLAYCEEEGKASTSFWKQVYGIYNRLEEPLRDGIKIKYTEPPLSIP